MGGGKSLHEYFCKTETHFSYIVLATRFLLGKHGVLGQNILSLQGIAIMVSVSSFWVFRVNNWLEVMVVIRLEGHTSGKRSSTKRA